MTKSISSSPSEKEMSALLQTLQLRFEKNMHRHQTLTWEAVKTKLLSGTSALNSLFQMENTGGEPDIVRYDSTSEEYIFMDCAKESPAGRRSLCYDREALNARKEHKPANTVIDMAHAMGIELLTEQDYRLLQSLETVDTKTSSWIVTPTNIRKLGGALFCDRRYDTVFVYHNGAESYYAARGFRGKLRM